MGNERHKEKIILKVNVIDHLDNIKNMNIKSHLAVLDVYFKNEQPEIKKAIRDSFLNGINSYHREVLKNLSKLLGE